MPKATFDYAAIADLLAHAASMNAKTITLVGDHGVYFMNPAQPPPRACVFAHGCNPETDDDWYDKKRQTFGGDDGAESFSLAQIQRWLDQNAGHVTLHMTITPNTIRLMASPH